METLTPREQAVDLHRQGLGNREISRRLGRGSSTIAYWINQDSKEKQKAASNRRYHSLDQEQRQHRYESNRKLELAKYGLTPEMYEELLAHQGGSCAICKNACTTGKKLAVDHCHDTGRVRGLLCASCNTQLGFIEKYRKDQKPWDSYLSV
jgi:IS30 family transposase